ncbi:MULTISPECIES: hypothetical protein [unclassified Cupriavidus]|uniref:hypothetical protein n=1 Tax=unclassified Cupriavidus TaxID=2640874 RepID=UPI001C0080D1|nr:MULTISPECIES: hypothetical protein [unclassified Cupriavidus]MCA3187970.1 hypothetical protein [Cupriavidus sp.]MCA3193018.1 hypothetical protein [Cupriavidus sp.]MCA3195870.1 hypothetical protein [Cupriavidus sp.]MCA3204771.1 hypothetical protein [Cupriavidus sp.]MCA3206924.1 hypothetical protein [Cupriavidus sp.]
MSDHPRFTVSRSMVMLLPEQPFLDWIQAVDPDPVPTLTLTDVRDDASVFLLPAEVADTAENALRWVEKRWRPFFEFMLGEWFDDSVWPEELSLAMFRDWFTVRFHSMVWDMAPDAPLEYEDWDDEEDDDAPTMLH